MNEQIQTSARLAGEQLASRGASYDARRRVWRVSSYNEVTRILRDAQTFSSQRPLRSAPESLGYNYVLFCQDGAEHRRMRNCIAQFFTSRNLARLAEWTRSHAESLIHTIPGDQWDLARHLAMPLPIAVICRLLGIEANQLERLKQWTEHAVGHHDQEGRLSGRRAFVQMHAYFAEVIRHKRHQPDEALISILINQQDSQHSLREAEIINFCITLLIAGNETSSSLISNTVNILSKRPALWAELQANRELLASVIEESLRFDSPVQFVSRKLVCDATVHDHALAAGEMIVLDIAGANRDPEVFDRPDQFLPERKNNRHLAFSHGVHFCIGATLARMEARIALEVLLEHVEKLEPAGPAQRYPNTFFRGFSSLPLRRSPVKTCNAQASQSEFLTTLSGTIAWRYCGKESQLSALYEIAKSKIWNASKDIPWERSALKTQHPTDEAHNPLAGFAGYEKLAEAEKIRLSWWRHGLEISEILHGEQGALLIASQLVSCVPSIEAKLFASSQVADEARHVEFFARYLQTIVGEIHPPSRELKQLIENTLKEQSWNIKFIVCQVLIESLAMAKFQEIRQHTRVAVLRFAVDYIAQDEARHVKFGTELLKRQLAGLESFELERLGTFVLDSTLELANALNIYTRIGESMGWSTTELRRHLREYRIRNPQLARNRFRQLSLNLNAVGLLTDALKKRLEDISISV